MNKIPDRECSERKENEFFKKFKGVLVVAAAIMLLNTVAFAATNSDSVSGVVLPTVYYSTSFKVTCGLSGFEESSEHACKKTMEAPDAFPNLSGASMAYSYQFMYMLVA